MAGTLSGGEQAMVALARALIGEPRLVIMDEPSLGLSPKLIGEYFEITREIHRRGTTILLIEQNAEMGLGIADRGYVLVKGKVAQEGPAKELLVQGGQKPLSLNPAVLSSVSMAMIRALRSTSSAMLPGI